MNGRGPIPYRGTIEEHWYDYEDLADQSDWDEPDDDDRGCSVCGDHYGHRDWCRSASPHQRVDYHRARIFEFERELAWSRTELARALREMPPRPHCADEVPF